RRSSRRARRWWPNRTPGSPGRARTTPRPAERGPGGRTDPPGSPSSPRGRSRGRRRTSSARPRCARRSGRPPAGRGRGRRGPPPSRPRRPLGGRSRRGACRSSRSSPRSGPFGRISGLAAVEPYDQDRPTKGYGQFCPMARASELVAQRWTTVIIRNLLAGATTFGGILDGAPGLSKTLLSQRLQQLERHRVIRRSPNPNGRGHTYHLTDIGMELAPVLEALGTWGTRWLDLDAEHLDPYPVLWDISKLIAQEDLPERRVVIRFDITDRRWRNRFWLVLE